LYADESVAEIKKRLEDPRAYIRGDNSLRDSPIVETVERVLAAMTGD